MQQDNTNTIPIPIYKGTYEKITHAYNVLHRSLYYDTDKLGITWEQSRNAQQRTAEIYAMVTGITPLSTLVVIDILYDMINKVISNISPGMKYIIDPEDIRRMDPNRRMHYCVISRFDIYPILLSSYQYDEYESILMFACSKKGNRYKLHTLYYTASYPCSPYVGCEHRYSIEFNPSSIDFQELEQHVYGHICQFAVKKFTDGPYWYFHSFISELKALNNELSEGNDLGNISMIMLVRQKYGVLGADGSITIKHTLPSFSKWDFYEFPIEDDD